MKFIARTGVFLLCLCLLGCVHDPAVDTSTTTAPTQSQIDALALYADSIAPLQNAGQLSYHVSATRQTSVGNASFTETVEQDILLQSRKAVITERAVYGNYATETTEIYSGGTVYAAISGVNFSSDMSWDTFTARYAPAVLLDASLYGTVTASTDGSSILFSDPAGAENWAADTSAELVTAEGTMTLDNDGNLLSSTYEITHTLGAATITDTTTVTVTATENSSIDVPGDTASYITIGNIDAIKTVEQCYGYLLQSDYVSSTAQTSIMSQAVGLVRTQQTDIHTYDQMHSVSQTVSRTNYSTGGETTVESINELFVDGKYSSSINGEAPTENAAITLDIMRNHCQELLGANIPDLTYISEVLCEDLGNLYLISFTGTEDLGDAYCKEINDTLFQNENFLNELSAEYRTDEVSFYLGVDKYTQLPTACGISYSGGHVINDIWYPLTLQTDQSFDLSSLTSYEAITGKPSPDQQPETGATPLFYHVTGKDGQQMWLLGTIHVGDNRTAFLPEEITNSFESADALAVEFDTEAFENRITTDTALQTLMAELCYHGDGLSAHLADSALYQQAQNLMKATGSYNYNAPYLRASLWNQALENFYLRQDLRLSATKGMDARLLKQARQQGKTILEIESGEAQIQMYANWSDALQEYLLKTSVNTDSLAYSDSIYELYEKWCQGDAAALTEAVKDDLNPQTDTEKLLYEEYNHSMLTARNAHMLDMAKTYLESDNTVFYAVGLAHLLGEDGLVNTLRNEGYTVTQVLYE